MKKIKYPEKVTLDEELVLSCAFRYALGRMAYVVGSVCSELKRHYYALPKSTKERISREIQEYQDKWGLAGMDFDNDEWNKIKWLFDSKREVILEANYHNTDRWDSFPAIKGDNGKYYAIPTMNEYHTVRNIVEKV